MEDPLAQEEWEIRTALDLGDLHRAAHLIVARYGQDVLGFLIARLRSTEEGREVFAVFSEDLWRGLGGFAFRCSVRCWVYTVARNAANRHALSKARRPSRNLPLSQHPSALLHAATQASSTALALRSDTKRRVRALRERLSLEDQTLLMLHVDRGLAWRELAQVMHGGTLSDAALERETVRVRKRFERIKARLRRLACADGLIEP
ncbi:MAG: DNA-directed polymerase sigma-70 factor [Myxococcaceae bacterium]|nr:DNA-directed polymerase sigma-70 factor [Myxococcaceae bacterium]